MCYMCEKDARSSFLAQASDQGRASLHFQAPSDAAAALLADDRAAASLKYTNALQADGVGDVQANTFSPALLIVTGDTAGDGIDVAPGNPVLTVGTPSAPVAHTVSTLDVPGDQDYYQVTLEAGKTYHIGMYAKAGGPSGVPLSDPYIEVLTDDGTTEGHEVVAADGGATSPQNNVNSGLDVLLTFECTETGTYYINARAFGNAGGPNGDEVGDYEVFVNDVTNDPNIYRPYYSPDSPLYSIDWGTQVNKVNQSVRNPDGNEGPRNTGNPQGSIPDSNPFQVDGKNVITIYFAREGDVFTSEDPANPGLPPVLVSVGTQAWEKATVFTALAQFSKVADLVYVEVDNREDADFIFTTYSGTPGPGVSLLGSMSPPDYYDEGLAQFNSGDYRWTEQNLQQGGFSYVTLIHEFGHGHGLAHPHDTGGYSGEMREVEGTINTPAGEVPDPTGVWPNYTLGQHDLNQQIFTMMSYQDGWPKSPYGNAPTDAGYGYLGGLSAFDIAVIQDKYGVNEAAATGNTTYRLKDVNAAGTFYTCIWDTAGVDEIVYAGSRETNIDLRAATLKYEPGGGGWVSYAYGIYGGFTIANGVTIENATSGSGDDTLTGNNAHNHLYSSAGNDVLTGGAGSDILNGGGGNDRMTGGTGHDIYYVSATGDRIIEAGNQGTDSVRSLISYNLITHVENLQLIGTANITGRGNSGNNSVTGNAAHNLLNGGSGDDIVGGGAGNDLIYGSLGRDTLTGDAGDDRFAFNTALGSGNVDDILDFSVADDSISLANYIFTQAGPNGTLGSTAFRLGTAAGDATDRIIYDSATGRIFYDPDGAGGAAATLFATVDAGTALTHADFLIYG
jgi:serralysin